MMPYREFGGEQIHVYVWLSPFADHLKLSQLFFPFLKMYCYWKDSRFIVLCWFLYHNTVNPLYPNTK